MEICHPGTHWGATGEPLGLSDTRWYSLRHAGTRWDPLRLSETRWDSLRPAGNYWHVQGLAENSFIARFVSVSAHGPQGTGPADGGALAGDQLPPSTTLCHVRGGIRRLNITVRWLLRVELCVRGLVSGRVCVSVSVCMSGSLSVCLCLVSVCLVCLFFLFASVCAIVCLYLDSICQRVSIYTCLFVNSHNEAIYFVQ